MDVELLIHSVSSAIEENWTKAAMSLLSDNKNIRLHFGARTTTILLGCLKAGPVYEIPSIFSPKVFLGSRSGGVPSGSPKA